MKKLRSLSLIGAVSFLFLTGSPVRAQAVAPNNATNQVTKAQNEVKANIAVDDQVGSLTITTRNYTVTFDKTKGGTLARIGGSAIKQTDNAGSYMLFRDPAPVVTLSQPSSSQVVVNVKAGFSLRGGKKSPSEIRADYRYAFHEASPLVECKAKVEQDTVVLYSDVYGYPQWPDISILRIGDRSAFSGPFGEQRKEVQVFFKPGQTNMFEVSAAEKDAFAALTRQEIPRGKSIFKETFADNNRWYDICGTWVKEGKELVERSPVAGWAWTVAGESGWQDYIVEVDVYANSGSTYMYLAGRWQDMDNHYELEYMEHPGNCLRINLLARGRRTKLAEKMGMPDLRKNPSTRLSFSLTGNRLRAYRDQELVLEAVDNTFSSGRIALGTASTYPVRFSNLEVFQLPAEKESLPKVVITQPPARHGYYREEDSGKVLFRVSAPKDVDDLAVSFVLRQDIYPVRGDLDAQSTVIKHLPGTTTQEVSYTFQPKQWRSGDYSLEMQVRQGEQIINRDTVPLYIRRRPSPDRFLINAWDSGQARRMAELGFNQFFLDDTGTMSRWVDGKPRPPDNPLAWQNPGHAANLQRLYDKFDDCLRYGMWGSFKIQYNSRGPEEIPEAWALKRDGSGLQDNVGQPMPNPWHPAVTKLLEEYFGKSLLQYKDLPAWHTVLLSSETDNDLLVFGNDYWLKMARDELGFDVPKDVFNARKIPKSWLLPENGIIDSNDQYYRFYRWWWKKGSGINRLHLAVQSAVKKICPDVISWHDPALRQPFIKEQFPGIDMIGHWTYAGDNLDRVPLDADELRLTAAEGQRTMHMLQVIEGVPPNAPRWPYVKVPVFLCAHAPAVMRAAIWLSFSRGSGAMSFHGLETTDPLQCAEKGDVRAETRGYGYRGYSYSTPDTLNVLKEMNLGVLQPYGMVTRELGVPKAEVAFLLPNATAMLVPRDAEDFRAAEAGVLYAKLQAAHIPMEVVYEETVEKKGLSGYKAIVLPGCRILPSRVYEIIKDFTGKGGLVLADQHLKAELPNISRFPCQFSAHESEVGRLARIREDAGKIRKLLADKVTLWADSDSDAVVLHTLNNGRSRLLFVINNLRKYGEYIGGWNRELDDGAAQHTQVRIRDEKAVVYDILNRMPVKAQVQDKWLVWDVDLNPGDAEMYAILPEEIGAVTVSVPKSVEKQQRVDLRVEVRDQAGKPYAGLIPLKITITDSQGVINDYSDYQVARDGSFAMTFPIAENEPSGDWTVKAEELFTGKMGKAFFTVKTREKPKEQKPKQAEVSDEFVSVPEMWRFCKDPDKLGEKEQWFLPQKQKDDWQLISTYKFWDESIGGYEGDGWYAADLVIPAAPAGKKVMLGLGAVDENYTLWINGKYIADNLAAGTTQWDKTVELDITGRYEPGKPNHVVVRVRNTRSAGGIWKPVEIFVGDGS